MHQFILLCLVLVSWALPALGQAQESSLRAESLAPPVEGVFEPDGAARWRLQFEPIAWAPALNGELDLTGGSAFNIDRISLSEVDWTPAWQVSLREEAWTITFDGFDFETSDRATARGPLAGGGTSVSPGDTVSHDVSYAAYTLAVSRCVWAMPVSNTVDGVDVGAPQRFGDVPSDGAGVFIDVLVGARLYDLDLALSSGGSALADEDHTWVDAIVGARLTIDLPEGFGLDVTGDIGTFGSDFAWNIEVGLHYALHDNVAAEIGFRHLDTLYKDGNGSDPFEWDIALAGLYGSIVIRF